MTVGYFHYSGWFPATKRKIFYLKQIIHLNSIFFRFLGFRGETGTVMRHAIELLDQQQLVKIDGEDIVPILDVMDSVPLFYKYSIKVI